MITVFGPDDVRLHRFLEWAITRKRPVTITYMKQAKTSNGQLQWEYPSEGSRKPVLEPTVRTIEPWHLRTNWAGDPYVQGMDRDTNEPRSWRLDRIRAITYHKRGRQIIPAYVNVSHTKKA